MKSYVTLKTWPRVSQAHRCLIHRAPISPLYCLPVRINLSGVCFWGPANQLHCADTAQFMPNWTAASIPIKATKHTIVPDIAPHCYSKHYCDLKITDCQRMDGAWRQPHPSAAFSWRGDRRGAIISELVTEPGPSLAFWSPGWFYLYTT